MLKKQIRVLEIGLDESEQYSCTNCIDIMGFLIKKIKCFGRDKEGWIGTRDKYN